MKCLARFSLFLITFVLGLFVATLGSYDWLPSTAKPVNGPSSEQQQHSSKSPTGIKVMYAGWDPATSSRTVPFLKFVIYNGTSLPIGYSAHTPESPWPQLKFSGREQKPVYGCGTGIQTFYVLPGSSAEVVLTTYDFTELPRKGELVTAGFRLRSPGSDEAVIHTSEGFLVPEEFRREIRVWEMPSE